MSLETSVPSTSTSTPATFASLGLSAEVLQALDAVGYKEPTNVQRDVWASASAGRDLLVQSRTGTGKTAAFSLPLVDKLVDAAAKLPQALILCPTRELALQVAGEIERLAQFKGTRVTTLYGGAPMGRQVADLEAGVAIVVGTPGRVLDHLRRGTFDPSELRALVLDEADEMLSMGFARELDAIQERLPTTRQTLLFSATVPPEIERMAKNKLRDPEFVTLSGDHAAALTITHIVYMALGDKHGDLLRLLEVEDPESAIVFCNTKGETERVAETLRRSGFPADWLNGDLEQKERERVMQRLREGKTRFLVATDVAARGIDVSHVTHVINMDFPESPEAYLHRTGRTGRAGRTGTAISLIGAKDVQHLYALRLVYKLRPIEKQLPSAHDLATRAEADVVRFFVDAYADQQVSAADLALARRLLSHDEAERVVAGLLREHLGTRAELGHDVPGESAEARRAKLPPPVAEVEEVPRPARAASAEAREPTRERRERRREPGDRPERGERKSRSSAAMASPPEEGLEIVARIEGEDAPVRLDAEAATSSEDFCELFVNVGRRDGLKAGELVGLVTGEGKLGAADVGQVRVRDTSSFVSVRAELVDRAIEVLSGQVVDGRVVQAERARRSSRSGA